MEENWNITLSILESPDKSIIGQQKVFTNSPIGIGRGEDNDLIVTDPAVSRNHATLRITNDYTRVFITDMSTHGTEVSGKVVPKGLGSGFTIESGETIKIGSTVIRYELNLKSSVQSTVVGTMDRSFLDNPPPEPEVKEELVEEPKPAHVTTSADKGFNPLYIGIIVVCVLVILYLVFGG